MRSSTAKKLVTASAGVFLVAGLAACDDNGTTDPDPVEDPAVEEPADDGMDDGLDDTEEDPLDEDTDTDE